MAIKAAPPLRYEFKKLLLRGLGVSEPAIIFTTLFIIIFFTTQCYTQNSLKSSEIAKKSVKIKYSVKLPKKRATGGILNENGGITGENLVFGEYRRKANGFKKGGVCA